ncbi:MAG: succinate dehydrogenase/fumarate reductase iron-sulfur subunit [Limnochordales bacterium]|nr:MAG: succinate dehydrogenase/fumarate reductase iron-sulfur subunit [Bacillota bacterium]
MKFRLKIWRQAGPEAQGHFEYHEVDGISPDQSFLEMLDQLNEKLVKDGKEEIAFESDCREGICGMCGLTINGQPHGPRLKTTTCELRMRHFQDGSTITVEPFRADAFPIIKDLVVDRSAFDRIMAAGGYISVNTGSAPDANTIPVPKPVAEEAMDAAACIGCGACVAACPNASAALFVGAKISHLSLLPQGHPERERRVLRMVEAMDINGFGACSNHGECQAACPKDISIVNIARMRAEYRKASVWA